MGVEDHKRDERITFHNLGIAGHGERFDEANEKGWKMMTLQEIHQHLGHSDVRHETLLTHIYNKKMC